MNNFKKTFEEKEFRVSEVLEFGGWFRPNNWLKVHGYPMHRKKIHCKRNKS